MRLVKKAYIKKLIKEEKLLLKREIGYGNFFQRLMTKSEWKPIKFNRISIFLKLEEKSDCYKASKKVFKKKNVFWKKPDGTYRLYVRDVPYNLRKIT